MPGLTGPRADFASTLVHVLDRDDSWSQPSVPSLDGDDQQRCSLPERSGRASINPIIATVQSLLGTQLLVG